MEELSLWPIRYVKYLKRSVQVLDKREISNSDILFKQANSENCGPPRGNKFDLEKVNVQGHIMMLMGRNCQKVMLYH